MSKITKNKYFIKYFKIFIFVIIMIFILLFIRSCMIQRLIKNQYSSFNASKSAVYPELVSLDNNGMNTSQYQNNNWHNQLFCFYDSGLSSSINQNFNLTVLFDFYSPKENDNDEGNPFYEPSHPYYSSFYGLYIIEDYTDDYFIDDNHQIHINHISKIPKYDYQTLILKGLGCPENQNQFTITSLKKISDTVTVAGEDQFIQFNCEFEAPGVQHHYKNFKRHYIQFGLPKSNHEYSNDFPLAHFYGRFYIKSPPNSNLILCFYIMSPSQSLVEKTENDILKKLTLNIHI